MLLKVRPVRGLHLAVAAVVAVAHHACATESGCGDGGVGDAENFLGYAGHGGAVFLGRVGFAAELPPVEFAGGDLRGVEGLAGFFLEQGIVFGEFRQCDLGFVAAGRGLENLCRLRRGSGELIALHRGKVIFPLVETVELEPEIGVVALVMVAPHHRLEPRHGVGIEVAQVPRPRPNRPDEEDQDGHDDEEEKADEETDHGGEAGSGGAQM